MPIIYGVPTSTSAPPPTPIPPAPAPPPAPAWPVIEAFSGSVASTSMSMPALRMPVTDPTFPQTRITRISDATELTSLGDPFTNFGPWYGNRQHWNSNETRFIVTAYRTGTDGNYAPPYGRNYWLFNNATNAPIHVLRTSSERSVTNHWRWSNTTPSELIFVSFSSTLLEAMDVEARSISTIKNFAPTYDLISEDFCGGVGDPSNDGRYWALGLRKPGGAWFVVCWDRQTDTVLSEIPVPVKPGTSYLPAVTMSRSGAFVVISGTSAWTSGATSIGRGMAVFNRTGTYLRSINQTGGAGATDIVGDHNSVATDTSGNDIVMFFHDDGVGRSFCSFRLDVDQSGAPIRHTPYGMILGAMYCSPMALGVNGLVTISDYPVTTGNASFNAFPLRNHSWSFYADGSQDVYPLAESRFSLVDYTLAFNYLQFPWTTPNRSGTKYMLKSASDTDWSAGSGGVPAVFHALILDSNPSPPPHELVPVISGGYRIDDATYARLWGPGVNFIDYLSNIRVGRPGGFDYAPSFRFRAMHSGHLASFRPYLIGGVGYGLGNGGTMRARVFPDTGAPHHRPDLTAAPLASTSFTVDMTAGVLNPAERFAQRSLSSTTPLVAGTIYHVLFDNTAADPLNNFVSIDCVAAEVMNGPTNRWLSPWDWGVVYGTRGSPYTGAYTWTEWTSTPDGGWYNTPILQVNYAGGASQGFSNMETGNIDDTPGYGLHKRSSSQPVRERFTPPTTRSVVGFSLHNAKISGSGGLGWALKQGASTLASGTIADPGNTYSKTAGDTGLFDWHDVVLPSVLSLSASVVYDIEFTPAGSSVWAFAMQRNGGAFGFTFPSAFTQSQAEHWTGSSWIGAYNWDHAVPGTFSNWRVVLHLA